MGSFIRHPKNFWTGIIFLFFGIGAVVIGQDYSLGTPGRMGPGMFPTALGALLALVGLIAVAGSMRRDTGDAIGKFHLKELAIVLAAVLLFGWLIRGAGLLPAALVVVLVSAYASPAFRLGPMLLLAVGLAGFAALLFVRLLGLPMPLLGPWFGS